MEKELWRDVVGYEGLYQISSNGRVKRLPRLIVDNLGRKRFVEEKILARKYSIQTKYPCVNLSKDGNVRTWNIHTLIADAFIPNPNNLPCVNHIDEDRTNSVLSNLERCSYLYNNCYGTAREKRLLTIKKNIFERSFKVKQYDLDGNLIAVYDGGYPEVREKTGYGESIYECLNGISHSAYGYVWRYGDEKFSYNPTYNKGKDFSNIKPKKHQKYVYKVDDNGNIIERYKSVSEAARKNGFDRHALSKTKKVDNIVCFKGMKFVVEEKENEYIPKGHKGARPDLKGKGAKAVSQYTKDAKFVRDFNSTIEAAEFLGSKTYSPEITNCCRGKLKTAHGYIWTYKGAKQPKPFVDTTKRKVEQYSLSGEYVATYDSIKDAAISVGNGKPGSIVNNLRGISRSAFGFVWKYAKI